MIVVMEVGAEERQVKKVIEKVEEFGFEPHTIWGEKQVVIGVVGESPGLEVETIQNMPGVERILRVSERYQLANRAYRDDDTVIDIGTVRVGADRVAVIAGPCAIESEEQYFATAQGVMEAGADLLRAGAYKPRTSPYSFEGLEHEGLELAREAKGIYGLPVVGEVMDHTLLEEAADYLDVIQIGARNMQNFSLLDAAGELDVPVLLKRGLTATYEELLLAAERIMLGGNERVMICERGIRTFVRETRNTLDLAGVSLLKRKTHLPVIVDPSHGTGDRRLVEPMVKAAIAAEADGVMVEVHSEPERALCDGRQSLDVEGFKAVVKSARRLEECCRGVDRKK